MPYRCMPRLRSSRMAESKIWRSDFLANNLISWTTWIPQPFFRSGEYMFLIAVSTLSLSSFPADPKSSSNLLTVLLLSSLGPFPSRSPPTPMALCAAENRQFPSASTSPPWVSRKTTGGKDLSSGCFHSTPFAWSLAKLRRCWSSRPDTCSHDDAVAVVVVVGPGESTATVGSRHVINGGVDGVSVSVTEALSHSSFPISPFLLPLFCFPFLLLASGEEGEEFGDRD